MDVGDTGRYTGVYRVHWEVPRLELVVGRWVRRRVWCDLVSDDVPWPAAIVAAASRPGAAFDVTVEAEVTARGSFGHRGSLRWRLAVRRWVSVTPRP